jgi:hypothetical protein
MKSALIIIFFMLSSLAKAQDCKGHIFYIDLNEAGPEVSSDLDFYYGKMKSYLNEQGVSSSIHNTLPKEAQTCFTDKFRIKGFTSDVGYLIVSPEGQTKEYSGVMTDVDLMLVVDEFLN